jgi:adenine-specific DNA-methyltransferase
MSKPEDVERKRQEEQVRLDMAKSPSARNKLGQFATPPELALEIAAYLRELWKTRNDEIRFLDPALGTGSFFSALRRAFPPNAIAQAKGIEIDPDFVKVARDLWGVFDLNVIQGNFTELSVPSLSECPNLILTNPPYVRHHHINFEEKIRLQGLVARRLGYALSGLSGLYCHFLLLAHDWLTEDGFGVWLIPSEFMDVNYGSVVRQYLTERVTLVRVHRFDPSDVQFDDALVTSAVIVFQKKLPSPNHAATFSFGGSLQMPAMEQSIPIRAIAGGQRWGGLPQRNGADLVRPEAGLHLSDLFFIKRGLATGANGFFILTRKRAEELGLPPEFLKPILPNPRKLSGPIIETDANGWPLLDDQLVLIDCRLPESHLKSDHSMLWRYLRKGEHLRIRDRYLVKYRDPWYSQEQRPPAPFLCTYMGRGANGKTPFRFFWNRSKATAHNVYLLLYPKDELKQILDQEPSLEESVFQFLRGISRTDLVWEGRVYGGGLHKLEPAELGRISGDALLEMLGASRFAPRAQRLPL